VPGDLPLRFTGERADPRMPRKMSLQAHPGPIIAGVVDEGAGCRLSRISEVTDAERTARLECILEAWNRVIDGHEDEIREPRRRDDAFIGRWIGCSSRSRICVVG
jgi:hypothetical protein